MLTTQTQSKRIPELRTLVGLALIGGSLIYLLSKPTNQHLTPQYLTGKLQQGMTVAQVERALGFRPSELEVQPLGVQNITVVHVSDNGLTPSHETTLFFCEQGKLLEGRARWVSFTDAQFEQIRFPTSRD